MNNDFSSIEKLVEFGLGLSVSQQMINTMNHAVNNMVVPGIDKTRENAVTKEFYAVIEKQQAGPFSPDELVQLIKGGKITKDTLMWTSGMSSWDFAHQIPDVNKLMLLSPPPIPEEK